jgi:hypothetical protein
MLERLKKHDFIMEDGFPFTLETRSEWYDGKIRTLYTNPEGVTQYEKVHRTERGAKRFHTVAVKIMTHWGQAKCFTMEQHHEKTRQLKKLWGKKHWL